MSAVTTDAPDLVVDTDGPVMTVTFNRPQARNAMTFAMYEQLSSTVQSLHKRPEIRVLVLTGAGDKAFASGTDISEFRAFRSASDAIAYEKRISGVLEVLEGSPVPVIAAIAGACTGGGMGLAACCDLRIAAANARFGIPIARTLGNCLALANHARMASLIGPARVKELILTARLYDAGEAKAAGLVHEVVDSHEALQRRARELATTIAGNAPITMRVTRESLAALAVPIDRKRQEELILKAYLSEDFAEGVDAFLGKRPPQWKGR